MNEHLKEKMFASITEALKHFNNIKPRDIRRVVNRVNQFSHSIKFEVYRGGSTWLEIRKNLPDLAIFQELLVLIKKHEPCLLEAALPPWGSLGEPDGLKHLLGYWCYCVDKKSAKACKKKMPYQALLRS